MNNESLAKTVLRLREAKGWSQEKLALEAKVSYHTVFRAEAGGELKTKSLQKLAKALEVSESELLGAPPPGQTLTIRAIKEAVKESLEEATKAEPPPKKELVRYTDPTKQGLHDLIEKLTPEEAKSLFSESSIFVQDRNAATFPKSAATDLSNAIDRVAGNSAQILAGPGMEPERAELIRIINTLPIARIRSLLGIARRRIAKTPANNNKPSGAG